MGRQTDRHDKATSCSLQFCICAQKQKFYYKLAISATMTWHFFHTLLQKTSTTEVEVYTPNNVWDAGMATCIFNPGITRRYVARGLGV